MALMSPVWQVASLVAQTVKRLPTMRETQFDPWVGKIPWRRKWQPTPVFLPGESHGRRSVVGYRPRDRQESDTTERLHFHFKKAMAPHSSTLAWKIPWTEEPGGLQSMGLLRVGHD